MRAKSEPKPTMSTAVNPKIIAIRAKAAKSSKRKTSSVSRVMARLTHQNSLAGMIRKGSTKHLMGAGRTRKKEGSRVVPKGLDRGDSRRGFVPGVSGAPLRAPKEQRAQNSGGAVGVILLKLR